MTSHAHVHSHQVHHSGQVLTVRAASGLSGDMMLAGLARMNNLQPDELEAEVALIGLPALAGCLRLEQRKVHGVLGWGCIVDLPHEHAHRTFADIRTIIEASSLKPRARELAVAAFALLAGAESAVHDQAPDTVHFHEVGALDSILDICLVSSLFVRLNPDHLVCSPLPLGDGGVHCAHGWLPAPAPAVLQLLENVPVCGFAGQGETITPTAMALLKALDASFGPWPSMRITRQALVYGGKIFPDAPNGAIWAYGPDDSETHPPTGAGADHA
ncbi:MAG: LarC family nickel insertion protein [Deltaproteobacteria bacterium]|jgi:uncharacterized protein (DUF111 family)|nr:LarC family nickel insertion protein [Deltaproteobacteria bacterium]